MAFPQVKVVARCTLHFIVSGSAFYSCLMRSDLNPQDLAVGWEGELSCGWEGSLSPTKVLGGGKLRFIAAFVRPQAVLPGVGVSRDDSHTAHKLSSCSPFDRQCSLDRWLHIPPQTYIKWIFFEVMVEPLLFHFRAGGQDLPFPTWLSLLKVPAGPAPAELGGGHGHTVRVPGRRHLTRWQQHHSFREQPLGILPLPQTAPLYNGKVKKKLKKFQ